MVATATKTKYKKTKREIAQVERLRVLMEEFGIRKNEVALICKTSENSVKAWLQDSRPERTPPEGYVDLVWYAAKYNDGKPLHNPSPF